jgi:hypothetical protein
VLIDRFLAEYDEVEHHEVAVDAPPERTYQAVEEVDLARSPVVLALLFVRGIPHLFTGAVKPKRRLTLDDILASGFVVLAEEPCRGDGGFADRRRRSPSMQGRPTDTYELLLGVVGRFWRPGSGVRRIEASEFTAFAEPGYAKAVWNFLVVERAGGGSTVSTETRVASTDADARRNFGWYWRLIGPFSALIRRIVLGQIKREAEQPMRAPGAK